MNMITFNDTHSLVDDELISRVKSLAARERGATAELVAHLAELDVRRLHEAAGYSSLFTYCRDVLLLSGDEAYNRVAAARAARRFPVILERLMQGTVSLTAVRLLAPHLTEANHLDVLESARGRTRLQVEEIVARLAPKPDVPASVQKLPAIAAPRPETAAATAGVAVAEPAAADRPRINAAEPMALEPAHAAQRAIVNALSPDRYKLQLTIGGDTLEKLRMAKDLLRHALPSGDDAAILDRALMLLVTDLVKKKFAATDRPRVASDTEASRGTDASGESPESAASKLRYIPAEVARAVFLRDFGRCAFVSKDGHRCGERAFLEFHHVRPYCVGGPPTVGNIELRCRRHNQYEWRQRSEQVRLLEDAWYGRRAIDGTGAKKAVLKRTAPAGLPGPPQTGPTIART
jgi:hypothetical protein